MDFTKPDDNEADSCSDASDNEMDQDMEQHTEHKANNSSEDLDESDEDDSDDEDDEGAAIVADINRLQEELSAYPFAYEKHITLIEKLRTIGELEILREKHEEMNQIFPLTPKIWLDWIEDETKVASTDEQRIGIINLYNRAVGEYLDSKIWSNFIQYSVELNEMNLLSIDGIRTIFDQALNHIGCSVSDGALIWRQYILFETFELNKFVSLIEDNSEQVQQHIKIISDLYHRQFSVPLLGMKQDYLNFKKWTNEIKETYGIDLPQSKVASIQSDYEKSLKTLDLLNEYENGLLVSDSPHLKEYIKYIDFELKNGSLARTQCLFERAITENCLEYDLWLKYLKFCDEKFVVSELLLPIYVRATRNCPWIAKIWVQYMLACERMGQTDDLHSLKDKAISCLSSFEDHKEIWTTFLNFLRRNTCKINGWNDEKHLKIIRETFNSVLDSLKNMSSLEHCYDLYRYFAKIEAKFCRNIENARDIWKKLIDQSLTLKREAKFWLDYANMELLHGNEEEYRKVLHKGLNMCSDYPESIGDTLVKFEMEDGDSIEQYHISVRKYEAVLVKINDKRSKQAEKAKITTEECKIPPSSSKTLKRKVESDDPQTNPETKKKKITEQTKTYAKPDESKREQTIFLSNLNFDLTEDEIREKFIQFGPISEIRLVRPKGFCFVEFEKVDSAHKALLHDRMLLRGRPVFISEMGKRNKFLYSTIQEKNKIFIKNIPFEFTKEDLLTKVFSDYADSVVDIRMVTYRDGRSKGLAYVEMKNSSIAEKVVKEKNDFLVADRKLYVAISDPSLAKSSKAVLSNKPAQNSKISSAPLMIPHSIMARSHPSKVKIQFEQDSKQSAEDVTKSSSLNGTNKEQSSQLSNDNFRSMFLK